MKLFWRGKDGGPESNVTGYFLIEWKPVVSIALMRFTDGTRKAYHSHAFDSVSWLLSGQLAEWLLFDTIGTIYDPSIKPIITRRSTFHKVYSHGTSWLLTIRGPWVKTWREYRDEEKRFVILANGRKEVA